MKLIFEHAWVKPYTRKQTPLMFGFNSDDSNSSFQSSERPDKAIEICDDEIVNTKSIQDPFDSDQPHNERSSLLESQISREVPYDTYNKGVNEISPSKLMMHKTATDIFFEQRLKQ